MSENIGIQRSDVLIVPCTDKILMELKEYALKASKEYISIEKRGDNIAVSKAAEDNLYIIGGMEYIGGLEFSAVIIIGADADKFPEKRNYDGESLHFINYSSFNKLYVAITRGLYEVAFVTEKTQKISPLLETACEEGLFRFDDDLANTL